MKDRSRVIERLDHDFNPSTAASVVKLTQTRFYAGSVCFSVDKKILYEVEFGLRDFEKFLVDVHFLAECNFFMVDADRLEEIVF